MATTFIKAAEIWLPSPDGMLLEFAGGVFGDAKRFAAISRTMCFGRGEGLPGRVWDQGRPILLPAFEDSFFRRTAAAQAAGLTCALGLPLAGGVLVLFCGSDAAVATLELWRADPRGRTGTTFVAGNIGDGAPRGGALSELVRQSARPELAGTAQGFAFPIDGADDEHFVATFVGDGSMPVARRIERWTVAAGQACPQLVVEAASSARPSLRERDGELPGAVVIPFLRDGRSADVLAIDF